MNSQREKLNNSLRARIILFFMRKIYVCMYVRV